MGKMKEIFMEQQERLFERLWYELTQKGNVEQKRYRHKDILVDIMIKYQIKKRAAEYRITKYIKSNLLAKDDDGFYYWINKQV